MKINQNNLEERFAPYILKCRPGDWEHAKRVVQWIKKLGANHPNYDLLLIAGYIHDIGWSGLVPSVKKLSRNELLELQPDADKQTENLVRESTEFLNLKKVQLATLLRLIKATETYESTQADEEIMVDADNLSKTDPNHVKEKYAKSDWMGICDLFEEKLPQRIKTQKGKKIFVPLLKELRLKLKNDSQQA